MCRKYHGKYRMIPGFHVTYPYSHGTSLSIYIYVYIYIISVCVCGGQNYLLPTMDVAKVGGPLSVVNVFAQI